MLIECLSKIKTYITSILNNFRKPIATKDSFREPIATVDSFDFRGINFKKYIKKSSGEEYYCGDLVEQDNSYYAAIIKIGNLTKTQVSYSNVVYEFNSEQDFRDKFERAKE